MDVLVALHDIAERDRTEDPPCTLSSAALHIAFDDVGAFVADGGDPDLVLRYARAMSARQPVIPSTWPLDQVSRFAREAVQARRTATTAWARSRNWAEEAVLAAEHRQKAKITEHIPGGILDRAPSLHGDHWRALVSAADTHGVPVLDLVDFYDLAPGRYLHHTHEGHLDRWNQVARWIATHGHGTARLMLAAGLSADEGDTYTGTVEDLTVLAALRSDRGVRPLW